MTVSTASLSFTRDSCFQNDHNGAVVMMHCNGNDDSDCTDALRSIAAIILSPPTCIDDKSYDDDDMPRLVSPRVVSPIVTCSLEQPLKGALAVNGFRDSAKKSRKHSRSGGHRLVGFSDNVSVIFIPRRCDYPKDLRDQLFPNKREISRNAARNMKEFASDGFDWRNVKEDQDPIHLADIWTKRETPLPAQPDLPKPRPQRPIHPKLRSTKSGANGDGCPDPVVRPSTPCPRHANRL